MKIPLGIQVDDHTQANFLKEILTSSWPGSIMSFNSFGSLREVSKKQRFGLVYLELKPDDELKKWISAQDDPVVGILSPRWTERDLVSYLDCGLKDYVLKPFQPQKLIEQTKTYAELTFDF